MDIEKIGLAVLGAVIAAGAWVFRTILTNNRRVALLEQAIELRAEASAKADQAMADALRDLAAEIKAVSLKLAKMEGRHNAD